MRQSVSRQTEVEYTRRKFTFRRMVMEKKGKTQGICNLKATTPQLRSDDDARCSVTRLGGVRRARGETPRGGREMRRTNRDWSYSHTVVVQQRHDAVVVLLVQLCQLWRAPPASPAGQPFLIRFRYRMTDVLPPLLSDGRAANFASCEMSIRVAFSVSSSGTHLP